MRMVSNYLHSYEDKDHIVTNQPFKIEIITSDNGKSYGFKVTTSEAFLKIFNNPIPKVTVEYGIIFGLKKMSKLLYLFLKDALGTYDRKNRNVEIEDLKCLLNIGNGKTTNSNFIRQLKVTIDEIKGNSDIKVDYEVKKKRDLKSGLSTIVGIKFKIAKNKNYQPPKKNDTAMDTSDKDTNDTSEPTTVVETTEQSYEEHIDSLVESEFQKELKIKQSMGKTIDNPSAYKKGIKKNLIKDGESESKFKLEKIIKTEKSKLSPKIKDNKDYQIILTDGSDDPFEKIFITNDYTLEDFEYEPITTTIDETLNFINTKKEEGYYFALNQCDRLERRKVSSIQNPF